MIWHRTDRRPPARERGGSTSRTVGALLGALLLAASCGTGGPDGTFADAVEAGDLALARALSEDGADPEEPRVRGLTPLMRASARDDAAMVEVLLEAGAEPAATGPEDLTALHVAAQVDAAASLEVLVGAGADLTSVSANGMNALQHAADLGSTDVIGYLAGLGADLDASSGVITQGHGYPRDTGPTALAIAVRSGQMEAVEALLALGAAVDQTSTAGITPLLVAVFSDQSPELVEVLLAAGADPGARASCERGCSTGAGTSLDWAEALGRDQLVPLLAGDQADPTVS